MRSRFGAAAAMLVLTGIAATACSRGPEQQYVITGSVENIDGEPMSGCVIVPTKPGWSATEIGITTDRTGRFLGPSVSPGTYKVEARCSGLSPDGLTGTTEAEVTNADVGISIVVRPSP